MSSHSPCFASAAWLTGILVPFYTLCGGPAFLIFAGGHDRVAVYIVFVVYAPPSSSLQWLEMQRCTPFPSLPAPARTQNYPPSQGFISAQATGAQHGAPSLGLGPAITTSCQELGPTIASPGCRHLLHLHPSKGLGQAVLVGPSLTHVPCLFPSSPSTNLATWHNCFKLDIFSS